MIDRDMIKFIKVKNKNMWKETSLEVARKKKGYLLQITRMGCSQALRHKKERND